MQGGKSYITVIQKPEYFTQNLSPGASAVDITTEPRTFHVPTYSCLWNKVNKNDEKLVFLKVFCGTKWFINIHLVFLREYLGKQLEKEQTTGGSQSKSSSGATLTGKAWVTPV